MGQILGTGYAAGDKSKSKTTVNLPPELKDFYRRQTGLAGSMMPQYQDLLARAMGGDVGATDPYTTSMAANAYIPMAGTYKNTTGAYTPMEGSYQPYSANAYVPMAGSYNKTEGAYTPISGNFASVADTFQAGKEAYTAPYAGQIQSAQQQIRRATPSGGGQLAALAQATTQGAMQMGAARAAQGQRDLDARNALLQEDVRTRMGLGVKDTEQLGQLRLADIQALNTLSQADLAKWAELLEKDTGNINTLRQQDLTQLGAQRLEDVRAGNTLTQKDVGNLMAMKGGDVQADNQMMQTLLKLYASIFGGFNPQGAAGQTQESSTPGRLGFPGWEWLV